MECKVMEGSEFSRCLEKVNKDGQDCEVRVASDESSSSYHSHIVHYSRSY
jgi:hypothetical protein